MTATDVLFRPFRIGALALANRIVMAPMARRMAVEFLARRMRLTIAVGQRAGWA